MKFLSLALTTIPALASAKVLLAPGPSSALTIGETYNVEWLVDNKMTLELLLVHKTDLGWVPIKSVFSGIKSKPCNGAYEVMLDDSFPVGPDFGFWINGVDIDDESTGYAHLSDWFEIKAEQKVAMKELH